MKHQTRILLAGMMGNLIESFDMSICGLLSIYLAKYLIGDMGSNLLIIFATFFVGYLARPIGALCLGLFSDYYGRKITLAASILSMGISTAVIGIIPTYHMIGPFAIGILLLLRIIQSFSSGAEFLNTSAYLVENAEQSQKGYFGSWASFGTIAGDFIASIVILSTAYFISTYPNLEWITWRIPFIFALLGSSVGLYVRLCIPESLEYVLYYADKPKLKFMDLLKQSIKYIQENKLQSLYVFALSSLGVSTTVLIYVYGPIHGHLYSHFTDRQIMTSNIISLITVLCLFPIMGKLSDRINREKIVIFSCFGFLCLFQPYFYSLSTNNFERLILIQALISIPGAAYYAIVPVILAEMFPVNLRCTVLSVLYSIAASFSAGLMPLLSLTLVKKFNSPTAPALLVTFLVLFVFFVINMRVIKNKKSINCETFVNDIIE